jgi:3-deoxy-D-manno-octulosonate 8-phosphate phosphatase (KDO 8-P phosphatase)
MIFNKPHESVAQSAINIKMLLLDVDGVLTDGNLYFSNSGEESKAFNSLDGHGIKMLQSAGIQVGIITGRTSELVAKRASDLGIDLLYQGREDKLAALGEIMAAVSIEAMEIAYAGDDFPDLPVLDQVGRGFSVANGHEDVKSIADAITSRSGGHGAVREITDFLLQCQGIYET